MVDTMIGKHIRFACGQDLIRHDSPTKKRRGGTIARAASYKEGMGVVKLEGYFLQLVQVCDLPQYFAYHSVV